MRDTPLRIGTRGSKLALAQTKMVCDVLAASHSYLAPPEIIAIKTTGDQVHDRPLADMGGKGLFIKEIEEALLADRIDLAVHSVKDIPTILPAGLVVDCLLPREDPRDALFAGSATSIDDLPRGAVVGTVSLRRSAQLLTRRPDLKVVPLRGNVDTRLNKLAAGAVDVTLLAVAGLKRLGMEDRISTILEPEDMLPAAGQGAVGVECRADDVETRDLLTPINHSETALRVTAERALLEVLGGSCRTPIAALAELEDGVLCLRGLLAWPDGSRLVSVERRGEPALAIALGREAGAELKETAGPSFLDLIR